MAEAKRQTDYRLVAVRRGLPRERLQARQALCLWRRQQDNGL